MELDPRYCDVIVRRWENLTGQKATLEEQRRWVICLTDEEINKIKKDYKKGFKYNEIESKYNITHSKLNSLIRKYKWKRKSNKSKVQKGNKNAVGNKGGTGAPKQNQKIGRAHV